MFIKSADRREKVVIDITDWNEFLFSGRPIAGIQRVTLNLIRSMMRLKLPHVVIRYDVIRGQHRLVDPVFFSQDFSLPRAPSDRGHMLSKDRYRHNVVAQRYARFRFDLRRTYKRWKANPADCFQAPYRPADDDVIFLPGAGWQAAPTFDAVAAWKRRVRLRFVVELYDLIPFHERYFRDRAARRQFRRWLQHAAKVADAFVLLSRFTEADFDQHRARLGVPEGFETVVITPPHEFENGDGATSLEALQATRRKRYALCVAHIFSHKNGRRVLDAWSILNLVADLDLTLVVAGGTPAAEIERVFGKMRNVVIVESPSDLMLINLYRHAEFTIFPSLIEGWGMPVGESLWFGRPCLASNLAAIPEVGGEQCTYFDPRTPGELEQLILERACDPSLAARDAERIDRKNLKSLDDYAIEICTYLTRKSALVASLDQ